MSVAIIVAITTCESCLYFNIYEPFEWFYPEAELLSDELGWIKKIIIISQKNNYL